MSAPADRVTGDHVPLQATQLPFDSVASSRSRRPEEWSTPEIASAPSSSVTGTERLVSYPPAIVADWPVGPAVSGVTVNVALLVWPALLCTVTVCGPDALLAAFQS